jgi:hypothetical protein
MENKYTEQRKGIETARLYAERIKLPEGGLEDNLSSYSDYKSGGKENGK